MKKCPNCGYSSQDDRENYCPRCGSALIGEISSYDSNSNLAQVQVSATPVSNKTATPTRFPGKVIACGIISLVLGILSLLTCLVPFAHFGGFVDGLAGLVVSFFTDMRYKVGKTGRILSIIGFSVSLATIIIYSCIWVYGGAGSYAD